MRFYRQLFWFSPLRKVALLTVSVFLFWAPVIWEDAKLRGEESAEKLNPDEPASRELVLETLREWIALPPEVLVHWDRSVEEGKIPENVLLLSKEVFFNPDNDAEPVEVTLPDGEVVYGLSKEQFGPNFGANIHQEDLDKLMPDILALMKAVESYAMERYGDPSPETRMHFDDDELQFFLAFGEEGAGRKEISFSRNSEERTYYLEKESFLKGSHIFRGRKISFYDARSYSLGLTLTEEGQELLAQATRENTPGHIAIVFKGEILNVPTFREELSMKDVHVTGLDENTVEMILEKGNTRFFQLFEKE